MTTGLPVEFFIVLYGRYFLHTFVDIFLVERQTIVKGLHRGSPLAVPPLVGPFIIVPGHEEVEIGLDVVQGVIKLFSEGYLVEFLLNGLIETFNSTIGLWMPDFDPRVFNVVEMEKELIGMAFGTTAIFRAIVA